MELSTILAPQAVLANVKANSKKQVLQELASAVAPVAKLDEGLVFDTLLQRERLGSTGVGNGVAIPHGKFPMIAGMTGLFARLARPIPFDAIDDQPVDIVFMLLAAEGSGADHLKALSRIARILRDQSILGQIRASREADTLYSLLTEDDIESVA